MYACEREIKRAGVIERERVCLHVWVSGRKRESVCKRKCLSVCACERACVSVCVCECVRECDSKRVGVCVRVVTHSNMQSFFLGDYFAVDS